MSANKSSFWSKSLRNDVRETHLTLKAFKLEE